MPWDSTQNQRRCGLWVMLVSVTNSDPGRKGKEERERNGDRTNPQTLPHFRDNPKPEPIRVAKNQEAGAEQGDAGAPLPAERTNHRTAPGPDLGARFPVTSGLPHSPASPGQSRTGSPPPGVRGSVYLGHPNPHHEHPAQGPRLRGGQRHGSGRAGRRRVQQVLTQLTRARAD